jgi:predicted Rossmann fold nucleotide-binding protein DprA/Smf involved in DNA uptake
MAAVPPEPPEIAAWLALAFRTALPSAEVARIANGDGPKPGDFPPNVIEHEIEDLKALAQLGVHLITVKDPEFPRKIMGDDGPYVLQVAGRAGLLGEGGVKWLAGHRTLGEALDRGDRVVAVLSKGLLNAKTMLRQLHDALEDGQVALVSAEPPRATWNRLRDQRRDELVRRVAGA